MSVAQRTAFDLATAHRPLGDGRFAVEVAEGWGAPVGPNGGYVAAIVLRAMQAAVADPGRRPRSLTLHYLRSPQPGREAVVEVTVERAGGSMTSLSARLVQDERLCVTALAAVTADYPAAVEFAPPAPAAPPPETIEPVPVRESRFTLLARLRMHHVFGPPPFSSGDDGTSGGWLSLAEPEPLSPAALALYADAWWPAIWGRLDGVLPVPTIEFTMHFRNTPPAGADGPVLARFTTRMAAEGFFEEDGELYGADGSLLLQSRQLGLLRAPRATGEGSEAVSRSSAPPSRP